MFSSKKMYLSFNRLENVIFLIIICSFIVTCVIPFGWVPYNSLIDLDSSWTYSPVTRIYLFHNMLIFQISLCLCLSVSSGKSIFSYWSTDMPEWSLFPVRVKSSAMDWEHINTSGKAKFKYLHFETPEFSLKSMS